MTVLFFRVGFRAFVSEAFAFGIMRLTSGVRLHEK